MITDTLKNHTRLALEQATVKISTNPGGFKGTGFFINTCHSEPNTCHSEQREESYILTAWHCIKDVIPMPFVTITVETIDGNTFTAQLDKEKSLQAWDIAVLKIDYTTEQCVPLGLITEAHRGDEVIAIGYPAGYIEGRGIGVYDGMINQLLQRPLENTDTVVEMFETTAIEGQGQSGGLIYHFESQRLIGLAKEIYHNDITKTTGLAVRFERLFAKWPQLEHINQQVAENWDEYLAKGPKPLTATQLQGLLTQVSEIKAELADIADTDWPFPVYQALQRLAQSRCTLQDYLNVFEAFIHLHFVTLASQFYWAFSQQQLTATTDELQAGLAVLHESLVDPACGGALTWLRRSAVLSLACQSLTESLPVPEIVAILEPATLTLTKQPNTNPDTQQTQPDFWLIAQGGERWAFLTALVQLRRRIQFYEPLELDAIDDEDDEHSEAIEAQLETLLNTLSTLFEPYRQLQLALVSETLLEDSQQRQVGIHCYWQDAAFLCVTNKRNLKKMANIWTHQKTGRKDLFKAPTTPRPAWQWDESLLLYQPQQPYDKAIYLMPLGFRYRHRDVSSKAEPLPGLLDSVRWKQERVASVLQRTYQDAAAPDWQLAAEKPDHLRQNIEHLVQELCENFAFQAPRTDTLPVYIRPQFDLQHELLAIQIAAHTVERPPEIARVLALLKNSPAHRLLLEGESGSGKSVLLAQIYQNEPAHTVFVSMDLKPEPLAAPQETATPDDKTLTTARAEPANVALRIGLYCLTVLNRCMQLPLPNDVLTLSQVQTAIRDNLRYFAEQQPQTDFMIVLDGANQAPDPGGLLSGLPGEILDNLYILVSSQAQERVRQPLSIYTDKTWQLTDINALAQAEAEAVVWHYWTQTVAEQPTPQRADLPDSLLQQLCAASHNVPIFLEDGTQRLRAIWAGDSQQFVQQATVYFQQHHATALPKFLKTRLEDIKQAFEPPQLLEALLWCLSLIQKSLTVRELQHAIQALRRQALFADLPAVSNQQIEDGLSWLGGFLRLFMKAGEEAWQLSHEMLGLWFCEQHGLAADLPSLRLSLVPFGAVPLPEKASEAEFGQWFEWVKAEDYEHYDSLAPELQVSVLDSLLAHLPEKEADHAFVLAGLGFVFLYGTGEQQRAFALESALQQASQQHHFPARIRADVLQILGDIHEEQNQLDKALEYFEGSLSFREQLLSESATPQNRRDVGIALNRLGDLFVSQNQLETALQYFERSLSLSEQLLKESPTQQNRSDVASALNRIGDVYESQNQLERALEYFERSLSLSEQLMKESATPKNRHGVAYALNSIGGVYESQNQLETAKQYFERDLQLREQLMKESATPLNLNQMSVILERIGDIYVSENQLDKALEYFERTLMLREQLMTESATPQNRSNVAYALNSLGDLSVKQNQLDKALQYFERNLQLREQLMKESATPQNRRELAVTLNRLGDIYVSQNQLETALQYFERSLSFLEQLLKESATPQNRSDVGIALNRLGDIYVSQNQLETALQYFERSLSFLEQLLKESATPQNRSDVGIALNRLGDIYVSQNQLEKALEYFERSLSLCEQLTKESATPQNRRYLAVTLKRLGDLFVSQNQLEKALEYFERSLSLSEQLMKESATPQNRQNVAYALNRIGGVYVSQNQLEKALEYFERSLSLSEQLLKESRIPQTISDMLVALGKLTNVQRRLGQPNLAIAQQAWTPLLWQQFRQQIWLILTSQQQTDLLNHFPQTEAVQNALTGRQPITTRPTLGFTIAAAQWAEQTPLLYRLIDFAWWKKESTPEAQATEQLELLSREQHDWGIIWSDLPLPGVLKNNPLVSEELSRAVEQGLAMTTSLKNDEKQWIIENYAQLSCEQVEGMLRIFTEEQRKLALLAPDDHSQVAAVAQKARQEWEEMLQSERQITSHVGEEERAVAQNAWTPLLWQQFRQQIWLILTTQQQTDLLNHFPQTEAVQNALTGQTITTRPTLGFTIAAAQWAEQTPLLYRLIDFAWWTNDSTPEAQADEQLELLSREQHDWGIIWSDLPLAGVLKNHPLVSEEVSRAVEQGLAISTSIKSDEKQRIIENYAQFSGEQVEGLLRIFIEEQRKWALLAPEHHSQLAAMAQKARQEWEEMLQSV